MLLGSVAECLTAFVPSHTYYAESVSTLAADGVFVGTECEEGFCPQEELDRAAMAVWTVRVLDGEDPAAVASTRFDGWGTPSAEATATPTA